VSGTVVLIPLVVRTRTEEAHLVARFGDDYRADMQRTEPQERNFAANWICGHQS
jgi:protein-S-isoprenylcysteine O-methyltransferase Ste14